MDLKAISHLGRFKDIVVILFRYGFDDVVDRLDVPGKVLLEKIHKVDKDLSTWQRLRHILEELGPTYIKIGQIISLRTDLIPVPLANELRKLQDQVTPLPFSDIRSMVEKHLQHSPAELFTFFDEKPLAAASLSQVHRAVLRREGRVVAVKVQRPGIRQQLETDLYILKTLAVQIDERMEAARPYGLPELVDEIRKTLMHEINFRREARNMQLVRRQFADEPDIVIPEVYEKYTTSGVLTMELMEGSRLRELETLSGAERQKYALLGLRMINRQILEFGFFHADPHPGNMMFRKDGVICLLDWGMTGRLTRRIRFELIDLINAIVEKDSERMLELLLAIALTRGPVNHRQLERDLLDTLDHYHSLPIEQMDLGQLLLDISDLIRGNNLKLPADLAIMIKALVSAEGTARSLYPQLNIVREAEPFVRRIQRERWHPRHLIRGFSRSLIRYLEEQKAIPERMGQLLSRIEHDRLTIRFRHENLDKLRSTLENTANRLTFAIIIAALIMGSSMIITTGVRPLLLGFPALGIIGYLVSGILGLWLVFNIIRSRKL